jgi:DNA-binding transcriptional LysR family regulator
MIMPRVIVGLAEGHPGIELDFMEASDARLEQTLREGSCEITALYNYEFHRGRCRRTSPSTWSPPLHLTWSCPPGTGSPAGTRSISRRSWPSRSSLFDVEPGGEYFLGIFHQLGLTPQIRMRTASYEMMRALVARGLGYFLLTQKTAITASYDGHAFVTVPLADQPDGGGADRLGPAHEEGSGIPGPVPEVVRPVTPG